MRRGKQEGCRLAAEGGCAAGRAGGAAVADDGTGARSCRSKRRPARTRTRAHTDAHTALTRPPTHPPTHAPLAGYFRCDPSVLVGRPNSTQQLADIVTAFPAVKGVGVGHSWWQQQFCSGNTTEAVGIVLTDLPQVLAL